MGNQHSALGGVEHPKLLPHGIPGPASHHLRLQVGTATLTCVACYSAAGAFLVQTRLLQMVLSDPFVHVCICTRSACQTRNAVSSFNLPCMSVLRRHDTALICVNPKECMWPTLHFSKGLMLAKIHCLPCAAWSHCAHLVLCLQLD